MFGLGPSPKSMASWALGGPALLIYRPHQPFQRLRLDQTPVTLQKVHGEPPDTQLAKVRRKGMKISREPEREHLVLGLAEISTESLMIILFLNLCALSLWGIKAVY